MFSKYHQNFFKMKPTSLRKWQVIMRQYLDHNTEIDLWNDLLSKYNKGGLFIFQDRLIQENTSTFRQLAFLTYSKHDLKKN